MKKIVSVCLAVLFLLGTMGAFADSKELDCEAIVRGATASMNETFGEGSCTAEVSSVSNMYYLYYNGTNIGSCNVSFNHYENGAATSDGSKNRLVLCVIASTDDEDTLEASLLFWQCWGSSIMHTLLPQKSLKAGREFLSNGLQEALNSSGGKYITSDGQYEYDVTCSVVSGVAIVGFGMKIAD